MPLPVKFRNELFPSHYRFISQYETGEIPDNTQIGIAVSYMEEFPNQVLMWINGGVSEMSTENFKRKKRND